MKVSTDLIQAGIFAANVDANDWVTLKQMAVPDAVRVASLRLDTITRVDALDDRGRIVGIETAVLRCAERCQREEAERKAKDAARADEIRKKALELLAKVQEFRATDWDLKDVQFNVNSDVFEARHMCALGWDSGRDALKVSGHMPSDIAAQIKEELQALKNYRAQIERCAQDVADNIVRKRIAAIENLAGATVYVRVGRAFVPFKDAIS